LPVILFLDSFVFVILKNNNLYKKRKDVMVKLYSNGTVYGSPPALITTSCQLNVDNFPYDEKICTMTWGR